MYTNIPNFISRINHKAVNHEIVKLDVIQDDAIENNLPAEIGQNTYFSTIPSKDSIIKMASSNATIQFINNIDEMFFRHTLKIL